VPTYEYECDACGHGFERLQRMTDPAVRKCPKCGKLRVRRLISGGAGVIFKGSGFYETDYKRKRAGGQAAKPKDESQVEAKPAAETKADAPKADAGKHGKKDGAKKP
jgi:putative FmdB family regulatory protein